MFLTLKDGKKIAMPRYYKDKIYNEVDRMIAGNAARWKGIEAEMKREAQGLAQFGEQWSHIKNQSKKAAFKKIGYDAKQRDKL